MDTAIPHRLATLGHPQRLAVFRLLMRRHPVPVPAGEVAQALGFKLSTSSAYLNALFQAGLLTQRREGTSILYAVDMAEVQDTLGFLVNDCCRGRPDLCQPERALPVRVMFLCSANSARSIMAEGLLRARGEGRFVALSAGTQPATAPHPQALAQLRAAGIGTETLTSKPLAALGGDFDLVLTVCDRAANADCPMPPGLPVSAHWGLPDPVLTGDFAGTFATLERLIGALVALPVDAMDRRALQGAVDALALTLSEETP